MRNLKKLLAVILTVVMITSMMIPALAANTYEAEALKLQAINVFAGGPEDLKLDEGVTRIQGLTFAIRIAGKDAEALAMDDAEVAEILADWTDADSIPAWGKKYAAYAIKNNITVGLSTTEKIFGALNPITGTSFLVFVMKSGMGYADVTTANVLDAAVNAGIVTASQAVTFAEKALIRDDAAAIMYGAFATGVNADGTKLIDAYIASGATTKEAAIEAGFVKQEVPAKFDIVDVSATNLLEIVVEFNQPVDEDSAEKLANYKLDGTSFVADVDKAELQDDGKTVIITVLSKNSSNGLENQKSYKLKVDGVKNANKTQTAKKEVEFTVFDAQIPVAESVEVTGPKSIKVNFSEPLKTAGNYKIDNGNYYANTSSFTAGDKSVEITIGVKFTEGTHKVTIENATDYYGFKVAKTTLEFDFVVDDVAPTAYIEKATETTVTLKFSKPVKATGLNTDVTAYYGYNKNNEYQGTIAAEKPDNNGYTDTYKVTFGRPIPAGSHVFYLNTKANKLEDKWGNDVESVELTFSVEVDNVKPEVISVVAEKDNKIVVTFSEEINSADAVRKSYYTLKNSDGKVLKTADFAGVDNSGHPHRTNSKLTYDADEYTVTIEFLNDHLEGGTYILEIKNIRDVSYAKNAMEDASIEFEVLDTTAAGVKSALIDSTKKKIRVFFAEPMSEEGLDDTNNYRLVVNGTTQKLPDDSKITIIDSKTIEIELGATVANLDGNSDKIQVSGNLSDIYGNKISGFYAEANIVADAITNSTVAEDDDGKKVVFTRKDEFEVYFAQELKEIDASKISVDTSNSATVANAFFTNDSGKSTVTIILDKELSTDASEFDSVTFAQDALTNLFGTTNDDSITINTDIAEKIAPEVVSIQTKTTTTIEVTFSEEIDDTTVSKYTFTVDGNTVTGISWDSGKVLTLTLKDAIDTDATPDVALVLDVEDANNNVLEADSDMPSTEDGIPAAVVTPLGATIAAGETVYLEFSEELKDASKTAITNQIKAAAGGPSGLVFEWGKETLTIKNNTGSEITFSSDLTVNDVEDLEGNKANLLIIDIE